MLARGMEYIFTSSRGLIFLLILGRTKVFWNVWGGKWHLWIIRSILYLYHMLILIIMVGLVLCSNDTKLHTCMWCLSILGQRHTYVLSMRQEKSQRSITSMVRRIYQFHRT